MIFAWTNQWRWCSKSTEKISNSSEYCFTISYQSLYFASTYCPILTFSTQQGSSSWVLLLILFFSLTFEIGYTSSFSLFRGTYLWNFVFLEWMCNSWIYSPTFSRLLPIQSLLQSTLFFHMYSGGRICLCGSFHRSSNPITSIFAMRCGKEISFTVETAFQLANPVVLHYWR